MVTSDAPPPGAPDPDAAEVKTLLKALWRAGALKKTRRGLLKRSVYEGLFVRLHYALLPNLMDVEEARESALVDWDRDLGRSGDAWAVDLADISVDSTPSNNDAIGVVLDHLGDDASGLSSAAGLSSPGLSSPGNDDDSYGSELRTESDLASDPGRVLEEPDVDDGEEAGVDYGVFAYALDELAAAWLGEDAPAGLRAALLWGLFEAVIGNVDDVRSGADAKTELAAFRDAGDVPCLAEMPLALAIERFRAWLAPGVATSTDFRDVGVRSG